MVIGTRGVDCTLKITMGLVKRTMKYVKILSWVLSITII